MRSVRSRFAVTALAPVSSSYCFRVAAQGRMLLLGQGFRQGNSWWQNSRWEKAHVQWPVWLVRQLEVFRRLIEYVDQEVEQLTQQVAAAAPKSLPVGMGSLTYEVIASEMKDFKHFQNRRQVGSYPGLTGGVSSSGEQHADLSITKTGNRRLSTCLVECAWRLVLQQPNYWLVKKWRPATQIY